MKIVRRVEASDLPALSGAFPESPGAPVNRHARRLQRQRAGLITYLAAWDDEVPVGHVFVRWPVDSENLTEHGRSLGCAEVGDLLVSEPARGHGVGWQLMEAVEELVRERGVAQLGLEVTATNPNQEAARLLYRKLGFEDSAFGHFTSGYTYWDSNGNPQRDEELYSYVVKKL